MGSAALEAAVALITQAGTYRLETKTNQQTTTTNTNKQTKTNKQRQQRKQQPANQQQQQTILIWTWFTSLEINEFHISSFFNVNFLLSTIPLQKLNRRKVGRETLSILNRDTHSFVELVRVNNDSVYTQSQRPCRCWVGQRTEQKAGLYHRAKVTHT